MALCNGGPPTIFGLGALDQGMDPRAQLVVGPIGGDQLTLYSACMFLALPTWLIGSSFSHVLTCVSY